MPSQLCLAPSRCAGYYGVNPEKDQVVQLRSYSHDKDVDDLQDERGASRS